MDSNKLPTKSTETIPEPQALTQARFAARLSHAMAWARITGAELAGWIGKHPNTVYMYCKPGYESGPPSAATRRLLEERLGLPAEWFETSDPLPRKGA